MIRKSSLLALHRWIGLCACGFLLLQALTGSLLLFRGGLAQVLDPAGMVRQSASGEAPLSQVLASVQARYPGGEIQRVVWPQEPRGVYFLHLADAQGRTRFASVDPGDARVLRTGGLTSFPAELVLAIHFRLVTGRVGLALMLLSGLALTTMAVSGLIYWWPRPGRWKAALKIDPRAPVRVLLRQAHRAVGAVVAALALASALTGLAVGLEYLIEPGPLTSVTPHGLTRQDFSGVDQALAAARAVHPGEGLRDVRLPAPGKLNVFFWAPARSALAVDGIKTALPSAQVVAVAPAKADSSIWVTVLPLHSGEAFGLAGRLILLLGGLGVVGLAVTGPVLWLQRRR